MDTRCYATAAHAQQPDLDDTATSTIEGESHGVRWSLPTCDTHANPHTVTDYLKEHPPTT